MSEDNRPDVDPAGNRPQGDQLTLDALASLPPSARADNPGTSWAASRDPEGHRLRLIDVYITDIAGRGRRGATVSELQSRHGGEAGSISRRMTDLSRLGWTRHDGERRSTRTGRWQRVHVATSTGLARAAEVTARRAAS